MIVLPSVTPITRRVGDLITSTHIISASVYYTYGFLNSYAYFRFSNVGLYEHFEKVLNDNPNYCPQVNTGFDLNLMSEINYIFSRDEHVLIPHDTHNGIIYRARRSLGMHYDRLDTLQKAKALELGCEFFEKFGCDRFGNIGRTSPIPLLSGA